MCDDARTLKETGWTNASGAIDDLGGEREVVGGDVFAKGSDVAEGEDDADVEVFDGTWKGRRASLRTYFGWIEPDVKATWTRFDKGGIKLRITVFVVIAFVLSSSIYALIHALTKRASNHVLLRDTSPRLRTLTRIAA
jgi:hypothetical protein